MWDQIVGRCDRQDPNGMREVAWPKTASGAETTAKGLKECLKSQLYNGKCCAVIVAVALIIARVKVILAFAF